MNMNWKTLGEMGENALIGELSKFGLHVAVPLSDNIPFDLIVITDKKLFKVQVKSSSYYTNCGCVSFGIGSHNFYKAQRESYKKEDCDVFALYDLRSQKVYLITREELGDQKSFSIRLKEAKNNQSSNCNFAEDLVLSSKRIEEIFGFKPIDFSNFYAEIVEGSDQYNHICKDCGEEFINGRKTSYYCAKCRGIRHRKVKNRPERDVLKQMIDTMSWRSIGKQYGVSDNAIKKWARSYEII